MSRKAKSVVKKIGTLFVAVALCMTSINFCPQKAGAEIMEVTGEDRAVITVSNPRIVEDESMTAGQRVTYDCIWFGSYQKL